MQPYLIPFLKLMINSVLIMPLLILALTFFKLFLNLLMYELNYFNQHARFFNVTMPINGNILLRMKSRGDFGKYRKQASKGEVFVEDFLAWL